MKKVLATLLIMFTASIALGQKLGDIDNDDLISSSDAIRILQCVNVQTKINNVFNPKTEDEALTEVFGVIDTTRCAFLSDRGNVNGDTVVGSSDSIRILQCINVETKQNNVFNPKTEEEAYNEVFGILDTTLCASIGQEIDSGGTDAFTQGFTASCPAPSDLPVGNETLNLTNTPPAVGVETQITVNPNVTAMTSTSITWEAIDDADGYAVYSCANGVWSEVDSVETGTSISSNIDGSLYSYGLIGYTEENSSITNAAAVNCVDVNDDTVRCFGPLGGVYLDSLQ